MLRIHNIKAGYTNAVEILHGVSLDIGVGEIVF